MSINKVILIGNLGRDPEVRFMPNGDAVATLNVATTEKWNDRQTGQKQENTEWHRVVVFGRLAEVCQQYLHTGSQVYLEGKLHTNKYTGKDGIERYSTEVRADVMKMVGGRTDGNQNDGYQQNNRQQGRPNNGGNQGGYRQNSYANAKNGGGWE